ncbi:MAG TPA: SGNH/GDSL hydrolase family protein, partial [Humisphaera sp.]
MRCLLDDNFARADAAAVGNGWTPQTPGVWAVGGRRAVATPTAAETPWLESNLVHATPAWRDQRAVCRVGPVTADMVYFVHLRLQANGDRYFFAVSPVGGAFVAAYVGGGVPASTNVPCTTAAGHEYDLDCTATGAGPTTLRFVVKDVTANAVVADVNWTNATAGVQAAGRASINVDYNGSRVPTPYRRVRLFDLAAAGATHRVVCDGNSWVAGHGAVGTAADWPTELASLLGPAWDVVNLGVGGQTTADVAADLDAQVTPLVDPALAANVYVAVEGRNHIVNAGAGGPTAYAALRDLYAAARDRGFATVAVTVPHTSLGLALGEAVEPADFDARLAVVNNGLRANWRSYAAALADVAAHATMADEGNLAYWSGDRLHPNDAGYVVWAQMVLAAVRAATTGGASGGVPTVADIRTGLGIAGGGPGAYV